MEQGNVLVRNNVRLLGPAKGPVLMLAQGFGCDQVVWHRILPFLRDCRIVLFDHAGTGGADLAAYSFEKYSSLTGYLDDLTEILDVLDLRDVTLVGHTVAGMMGISAAAAGNPRISRLVLIGTSACYRNVVADGYIGGLAEGDIKQVLDAVSMNFPLWAAAMAPSMIGQPAGSVLTEEFTANICRLQPEYVRDFLQVSLQTDIRHLLPNLQIPVLLLQTPDDPLTPAFAARYLHEHLSNSVTLHLHAKGNMPHVTAPRETAEAVLRYLYSSTHVLP
ncbi:alpha/beta hydrolase [Arthrobacter citreus]|uniref:Alpha/beta hydrolase n=1 Tax=Arthrobacter citreus TaxID=1670 RepID=A0ABZ2ZV24_9MICC